MSENNPWERQPGETAKAYAAFLHYRDLPAIDRSVAAAWGRKQGGKQWERWCASHDWVSRAAEHDSDLASRRRDRMEKALDRAKDDAGVLIRAMLAKVAERINGMDAEDLAAGQIPAALKTLIELELKALGHEDKMGLKHEGTIEVSAAGDAAWVLDYVKQLRERNEETPETEDGKPEG